MSPLIANLRRLFAILIVMAALCNCAMAQSPSAAESILVLKNGQTLEGEVSLADGKYTVRLPSGSAIRMPKAQVMFTAQSYKDAYWELAARTSPSNLPAQIRVFQWCVRNELFDEASNHLLVLQESDIPARRLAALDFELETKIKRATARNEKQDRLKQQEQLIAQQESKRVKRHQRVESMIGTRSVSIPDLHGSPLRPIAPQAPTSSGFQALPAIDIATQQDVTPQAEVINQFGESVDNDSIAQVSYLEPVEQSMFSTPATAEESVNQPEVDFATAPSPASAAEPETMSDPFDPEYFNREFSGNNKR